MACLLGVNQGCIYSSNGDRFPPGRIQRRTSNTHSFFNGRLQTKGGTDKVCFFYIIFNYHYLKNKPMKKKLFTLAALLITSLSARSQYYDWAVHAGAPLSGSGMAQAYAVAVDAAGSVYSAGYFAGTIDFDPGPGIFNIGPSGQNIFIQKVDKWGNFVWAKHLSGGQCFAKGITVDNKGYVYVTGEFSGTMDADPGTGITNLVSAGSFDIFVEKLDTSGNYVWAKGMGGGTSDASEAIALDASDNIYITGVVTGTADMDPGTAVFNLTGGNGSVFLEQLDASGNFVWAKNIGDAKSGTGSGTGTSLALDKAGNVFVTGRFKNTLDFDPGTGTSNLTGFVSGFFNGFVSKLDGSGNMLWAKQIGGNADCYSNSVVIDTAGNVYAGGTFDYTIDLDPGTAVFNITDVSVTSGFNGYIVKLDASGNYKWGKQLESTTSVQLIAMQADKGENIYCTGLFQGTTDFDPGAGVFNMSTPGMSVSHNFLLKLNDNGNFVWAQEDSCTNSIQADAIALDAQNNIYLAGNFSGTCDFDPGAGIATLTVLSGSSDMFVQKLYQFKYGSDAQTACGSYVFGSATYTTSGVYKDTVTATLGMDSIITLTLTVNPMPNAGTITGANNLCAGSSIILTDAVVGGVWSATNTAVSVSSGTVTGVVAGTTTISYTVTTLGCSASATWVVAVKDCDLGVPSKPAALDGVLSVYPNPVKDLIHIGGIGTAMTYRLLNMVGSVLQSGNLDSASNVVNVSNVVSGMYILEVSNADGQKTINRLIKQ